MSSVHIDIEASERNDFDKEIDPWNIEQAGSVDADSPYVESQYVCVLHQRSAGIKKFFAQVVGYIVEVAISVGQFLLQFLERRCTFFLASAIVGIVVEECFGNPSHKSIFLLPGFQIIHSLLL